MCEATVIVHYAVSLGVSSELMGARMFWEHSATFRSLKTERRVARNTFSCWRIYDVHHPINSFGSIEIERIGSLWLLVSARKVKQVAAALTTDTGNDELIPPNPGFCCSETFFFAACTFFSNQ